MLKPPRNHPPSYHYQEELEPYYPDKNDEKSGSTLSIRDTSDVKVHVLPTSEQKKVVDIINGYNGATLIHLADDTMMIYGYNAHGQLGLNHFDYVNHTEIPKWCKTMKIKQIFSGSSSKHSLLITNDNKLYGVGNNLYHQFGMKTDANTLAQWTEITDSFPSNVENIKSIATSSQCTTFLMENGQIYQTMYEQPYIQLIKSDDIKFKQIASGKSHVLMISEDDELYALGFNNYGQCGIRGINKIKIPLKVTFFDQMALKIDSIACGQDHSIVLTKQNKVYCFGRNDCYQVGNGSNDANIINRPQKNEILEQIHDRIIDIKCGSFHNMVITEKGEYFLWGRNKENQCLIKCDDVNNMQFIKIPTKYQYDKLNMEIMGIYLGYKETKIVSEQRFEQTNGEILYDDPNMNKQHKHSISDNYNDRNSGNKKRNNFQAKLSKFKAWYNKLKTSNNDKNKIKDRGNSDIEIKKRNNTNNDTHSNQLENIFGLNENKYDDIKFVNHQFKRCDNNDNNNQWYYSSSNSSTKFMQRLESIEETPEIESNTESSLSAGTYGEICYYSPKASNNNNRNIKHRFSNIVKLNANANDINHSMYHPMTSKEC